MDSAAVEGREGSRFGNRASLRPGELGEVERRLSEIGGSTGRFAGDGKALPEFFRRCFSQEVRRFLLAARTGLDWHRNRVDRTLMALVLVYLHGKQGQALSNQMRQTKAMSPNYAIKWWAENGTEPPDIDPVEFMQQRIRWRYAKRVAETGFSQVFMGNSVSLLPMVVRRLKEHQLPKAKLLLTSPPYYGVTNYHYDQWLRLWLLGFEPQAYVTRGKYQGRFTNQNEYRNMLAQVSVRASKAVKRNAVIYVRTSKETAD